MLIRTSYNLLAVSGKIELHAFMGLRELFSERQWTNPHYVDIDGETTGNELLASLGVPLDRVEVMFVNRKAYKAAMAAVKPGDRVALVPPGVPGPYRVLLGFKATTD